MVHIEIHFIPHREHVLFHYKDQSLNAVQGNNNCLLSQSCGTHLHCVSNMQNSLSYLVVYIEITGLEGVNIHLVLDYTLAHYTQCSWNVEQHLLRYFL
jgi:hypothetical protein